MINKERLTIEDVDKLVDIVHGTKEVENLKKIMQNLAEEANLTTLVQSKSVETLKLFVLVTHIDL